MIENHKKDSEFYQIKKEKLYEFINSKEKNLNEETEDFTNVSISSVKKIIFDFYCTKNYVDTIKPKALFPINFFFNNFKEKTRENFLKIIENYSNKNKITGKNICLIETDCFFILANNTFTFNRNIRSKRNNNYNNIFPNWVNDKNEKINIINYIDFFNKNLTKINSEIHNIDYSTHFAENKKYYEYLDYKFFTVDCSNFVDTFFSKINKNTHCSSLIEIGNALQNKNNNLLHNIIVSMEKFSSNDNLVFAFFFSKNEEREYFFAKFDDACSIFTISQNFKIYSNISFVENNKEIVVPPVVFLYNYTKNENFYVKKTNNLDSPGIVYTYYYPSKINLPFIDIFTFKNATLNLNFIINLLQSSLNNKKSPTQLSTQKYHISFNNGKIDPILTSINSHLKSQNNMSHTDIDEIQYILKKISPSKAKMSSQLKKVFSVLQRYLNNNELDSIKSVICNETHVKLFENGKFKEFNFSHKSILDCVNKNNIKEVFTSNTDIKKIQNYPAKEQFLFFIALLSVKFVESVKLFQNNFFPYLFVNFSNYYLYCHNDFLPSKITKYNTYHNDITFDFYKHGKYLFINNFINSLSTVDKSKFLFYFS